MLSTRGVRDQRRKTNFKAVLGDILVASKNEGAERLNEKVLLSIIIKYIYFKMSDNESHVSNS